MGLGVLLGVVWAGVVVVVLVEGADDVVVGISLYCCRIALNFAGDVLLGLLVLVGVGADYVDHRID